MYHTTKASTFCFQDQTGNDTPRQWSVRWRLRAARSAQDDLLGARKNTRASSQDFLFIPSLLLTFVYVLRCTCDFHTVVYILIYTYRILQ